MHKRTTEIIKNLGYDEKIINQVQKKKNLNRKTLAYLKKLGVPSMALKQIKFLEDYSTNSFPEKTNKELIELLIKKCRRSFDAFSNKGNTAKIILKDGDWVILSNEYSKALEKLHIVCKPYFDTWSKANAEVSFVFDGSNSWKIITQKESDLPGN